MAAMTLSEICHVIIGRTDSVCVFRVSRDAGGDAGAECEVLHCCFLRKIS